MTIWQGGAGTPAGYMGVSHANGVVFVDANGIQQADPTKLAYDQVGKTLTFGDLGLRIKADFSNATYANRAAFQSSTANGLTSLVVLPNGTSREGYLFAIDRADISGAVNYNVGVFGNFSGETSIWNLAYGPTPTNQAITFKQLLGSNGVGEVMRLSANGTVDIAGDSTASTQALRAVFTAGSTRWIQVTGSVGGSPTISSNSGDIVFNPALGGNAKISWTNNSSSVPTNFLGGSIGQNRSGGGGEVNFFNNYIAQATSFDWRKVTVSGVTDVQLMYLTPSGGLSCLGGFGVNGFAPQAVITGYGTPTGGAKQASFAAGSITLPNLAAAVAQLIIDLKSYGFLAA